MLKPLFIIRQLSLMTFLFTLPSIPFASTFMLSSMSKLFKGTYAWHVTSNLLHLILGIDTKSNLSFEVSEVDCFICHSWSCPASLKALAVCHQLNLNLAIATSLFAFLLATFTFVLCGGPSHVSPYSGWLKFFPIIVFVTTYLFGHFINKKTFWFDRISVDQGNLLLKSQTISEIPTFIARASTLMVLWDETLFGSYVDGLLAAVAEQITGIFSRICTNYQQGRLMPMCFAVTVGCFNTWEGDLVLAGAYMLLVAVLILLRMWKVQEGVVHLILSFAFATIQKSFALVRFATTSVASPKVIQEARKAGKQRLPAIRTGRHKLQARNVNLLGKEHRPKSIFSRCWDFVSHSPAVFRKLYVPCLFSILPPKQCEDTVNPTQHGGTKRTRAGVPRSKLRFVCPTWAAKRTKARRRPRKRRGQFEPKVQESEWSGKVPTVCFQQNKRKPTRKMHVASGEKFSATEHVALQGGTGVTCDPTYRSLATLPP